MIVLGSTYLPVMEVLARKLDPGTDLRPFDPGRPLVEQVGDIDVLIIGSHRVGGDVLRAAPNLKLLHQHGRGVDSVDRPEAARRGIRVANVPGGNSVAVAELTLALVFHMAKRFHEMAGAIAARLTGAPASLELSGKTLGIVGLGASGTELARRAQCLGMRVMAIRGRPEAGSEVDLAFLGGPGDLPQVLERSDFVCLLATLSEGTRGMIGRAELGRMKASSYLINTARGALVDYDALHEALSNGGIAGAAFDTFWSEPADPGDPMLALPNFVLSPHVAGFSDASIDHVTGIVAENIRRLKDGRPLANLVEAPR